MAFLYENIHMSYLFIHLGGLILFMVSTWVLRTTTLMDNIWITSQKEGNMEHLDMTFGSMKKFWEAKKLMENILRIYLSTEQRYSNEYWSLSLVIV